LIPAEDIEAEWVAALVAEGRIVGHAARGRDSVIDRGGRLNGCLRLRFAWLEQDAGRDQSGEPEKNAGTDRPRSPDCVAVDLHKECWRRHGWISASLIR
jgi:hypothetical protein